MTELTVQLPDDVLARIQDEANRLNVPVEAVVSTVLAQHFTDDDDDYPVEDPTDEQILAMLREGIEQALAGNVRPAREVLDEIEREAVDDADDS